MPLQFKYLCDLLSDLESHSSHRPPLLPARRERLYLESITKWFHFHKVSVDSSDVDAVVLLSALLPARRTDRVYSIQAQSLSRKLRRVLNLGEGRWQQLDQWKTPGRGDLGECVERVQRQAEFPVALTNSVVTLEEIDNVLANIAKKNRFSAPSVREDQSISSPYDVVESLQRVYHRLQSREAKWFTRMILKDYPRLELKEAVVFQCLDGRLPAMMRNQDSFESAINSLRSQKTSTLIDKDGVELMQTIGVDTAMPKIGVKVGRPTYLKGRNVKQVVNIVNGRNMSVERKYDGEYCQIHIDLSKGDRSIQIFSKSCKDSTRDRKKLHSPIRQSLRIGSGDCGFVNKCILEGEMVVWSDKEKKIMAFNQLRKHVSRSGVFLGTGMDSRAHPSEHPMIVFYDVLLIDDDPVLKKPYICRRAALERLVKCMKGKAKLSTRREVRFASRGGPKLLQNMLACAFVRQWEGIILKPLDEPYFRSNKGPSRDFASCWIKMKKDYIPGLGDTADFAVVGAGYCAKEAAAIDNTTVKWTHFYIGCLRNKDDVIGNNAQPQFTVLDRVNSCLKHEDLNFLNGLGQFQAMDTRSDAAKKRFNFDFQSTMSEMAVAFREPFVVELLGAGFDKLSNQNLFTLRFPRVLKVHRDRDWKDAVSLDELQQMAEQAQSVPAGDGTQEIKVWMDRLDKMERGAKGGMLPWDDSQEKGDSRQSNTTDSSKSKRSTGSSAMIRMDSAELTSNEQRLESGEVVERPDSPQSSTSRSSESTPRNSSNAQSSASLTNDVDLGNPPIFARHDNLKRLAMSEEHDPSRSFKKAKVQKELDQTPGIFKRRAQPLNNVTNSAFRLETPAIKPPTASKFSLISKMATGVDDRSNQNGERRLGSLSRGNDDSMPTPPSSSNPIEPPSNPPAILQGIKSPVAMPVIAIPDLTEHKVLLGSCVSELPYSLVTKILQPPYALKPITAFQLPSPDQFSGPIFTPEDLHNQPLLVLVDQSHQEATSEVMKTLIAFMSLWNPACIAIWDWRFLQRSRDENACTDDEDPEVAENEETEEDDEEIVKKYFIANMVPMGETGDIEIYWRGGKTTRM